MTMTAARELSSTAMAKAISLGEIANHRDQTAAVLSLIYSSQAE